MGQPNGGHVDVATKWLMGILATLITSGCVLWLTATNASITRLDEKSTQHSADIAEIKGQLPHVTKQLDRIEGKLDRVIENKTADAKKERDHE